jgi:hypothetical protein
MLEAVVAGYDAIKFKFCEDNCYLNDIQHIKGLFVKKKDGTNESDYCNKLNMRMLISNI